MADENFQAGCLLVSVAKSWTWDHSEAGQALNVDGLRKVFDQEARAIESEKPLFAKVSDLRPRLVKE